MLKASVESSDVISTVMVGILLYTSIPTITLLWSVVAVCVRVQGLWRRQSWRRRWLWIMNRCEMSWSNWRELPQASMRCSLRWFHVEWLSIMPASFR